MTRAGNHGPGYSTSRHPALERGTVGLRRGDGRRRWRGLVFLLPALMLAVPLRAAIPLLDTYYSPQNKSRPVRRETRFIILHTTEGAAKGSGEKLARRGEAHYMIDKEGRVYRIIDRKRVAYHCGRSMWNGRTSLDSCSVGIEMVGWHNRELTAAQYKSLRELLAELKRIYKVPDGHVLSHAMVAYGAPNRWQPRSHRGRKRCGMLMATPAARSRLGLQHKPSSDPDVAAGRLANADPELMCILYSTGGAKSSGGYAGSGSNVLGPGRSAWDIARDAYNSPDTIYVLPNGTRRKGSEITNWRSMPSGTKVLIAEGDINPVESAYTLGAGETPAAVAGAEWNSSRTLYIRPDGKYLRGDELTAGVAASFPTGTRVLAGYKIDGPITARRPAFEFCGPLWNQPDTFFLFPDGTLVGGDKINAARIPKNTMVIYKN